jgi:hypothetical protein
MKPPIISYAPFDELIVSLRADGLEKEAEGFHMLIYKVAWTTGSELLGELGQKMKEIEAKEGARLSTGSKMKLNEAFEMVQRVWPDFPR